ncbi:hypothetical protein GN958_ATG23601 [Phytophthora infestans]|uniref:Uncharacterized protein n=1 Tax=Phytophthora infestans TaxID=4787 RepID=A0A8S9TIN6_PHYIN|nr:hypothetical protein GN958_ATG23601 [Phytophthora infestans]
MTYKPTSAVFDYIYRPDVLEMATLMDFTKYWKKESNVSGERFLSNHGQATTHSLHRRKFPAVATLIGKRLPDARSDNVELDAQLTLQQSLLVLFKPFRRRGDFPKQNLSDFYVKWWRDEAPEIARQFLQNSNDYYTSRELARKRSDANMEQFRAMVDGDDYSDDGSNYGASEQAEEAICVDGSSDDIPEDYFSASPTITTRVRGKVIDACSKLELSHF